MFKKCLFFQEMIKNASKMIKNDHKMISNVESYYFQEINEMTKNDFL